MSENWLKDITVSNRHSSNTQDYCCFDCNDLQYKDFHNSSLCLLSTAGIYGFTKAYPRANVFIRDKKQTSKCHSIVQWWVSPPLTAPDKAQSLSWRLSLVHTQGPCTNHLTLRFLNPLSILHVETNTHTHARSICPALVVFHPLITHLCIFWPAAFLSAPHWEGRSKNGRLLQ